MQCATHPAIETELACSRCEKPICSKCLVHTPVGARCPECANVRRIPTYNVQPAMMRRAAAAAIVAGVVAGGVWGFFNVFTFFFFGIIPGFLVGYGVGEAVALATNRRSGPPLQAMAVAGVAIAYVLRVALLFMLDDWVLRDLRLDLRGLIAATIAVFIAVGRLR